MNQIIRVTLYCVLGVALMAAVVAAFAQQGNEQKKDDTIVFPAIKSISISKGLPDGSELGIIEVAGQSYFVVMNKGGDRDSLPEIVQRINCDKADKSGLFVGKDPKWEASCRSEDGKDHDPILVFHAGS